MKAEASAAIQSDKFIVLSCNQIRMLCPRWLNWQATRNIYHPNFYNGSLFNSSTAYSAKLASRCKPHNSTAAGQSEVESVPCDNNEWNKDVKFVKNLPVFLLYFMIGISWVKFTFLVGPYNSKNIKLRG